MKVEIILHFFFITFTIKLIFIIKITFVFTKLNNNNLLIMDKKLKIGSLQHKRSSDVNDNTPKLPTAEQLEFGEIAINYAKDYETLSIKNSSGDVVTFSSDSIIDKKIDGIRNDLASVVSVKLGADTEDNENFLKFEKESGDTQVLAVRSIDADSTVTTDRILVAGGPLDSPALRDILKKDENGNAYIEANTDIQSLLLSLFTKVEWPTPTVTEGKINTTIAAPSFTLKSGTTDASNQTYEVGTILTMSDATLSAVSNTTTARTCGDFTYGYSDAVGGSITKTKKISIGATNITVNGDNYTMSRDFTGFANADDSATPSTTASEVTLASADCVVAEGECKVKVSVSGPKGKCTFAEMPSYFVTSNIGTLSEGHKSPTQAEATVTEDTTPTSSKEIKVNGRYKYFMGNSTAQVVSDLNSDSIRGLEISGWTTVNGTTTIKDKNTIWESNGHSIVIACPNKYALDTVTDSMGNDSKSLFSEIGTVDVTTSSINTTYNVYIFPIESGTVMKLKDITLK